MLSLEGRHKRIELKHVAKKPNNNLCSYYIYFMFYLRGGCFFALRKGREMKKKPHKQISHLTWKSQDLIDLNAHGSEYDNFNINEQMSSFIMHAI